MCLSSASCLREMAFVQRKARWDKEWRDEEGVRASLDMLKGVPQVLEWEDGGSLDPAVAVECDLLYNGPEIAVASLPPPSLTLCCALQVFAAPLLLLDDSNAAKLRAFWGLTRTLRLPRGLFATNGKSELVQMDGQAAHQIQGPLPNALPK